MNSNRNKTKQGQITRLEEKEKLVEYRKKMRNLVQRPEDTFSTEDRAFIKAYPWLHKEARYSLRAKNLKKERSRELSDPEPQLTKKLEQLSELLQAHAGRTLVYTGAGMSTAAAIPDYRGPRGKWTLGERQFTLPEASQARPTRAHMALTAWVQAGLVAHVVSQNVDCLHLRSGIPRERLSEIHGNLFSELCSSCDMEVLRLFDVSERTGPRRHWTGRKCPGCGHKPLTDSIIHFGERSRLLGEPCIYRWRRIEQLLLPSNNIDRSPQVSLIICLGTSLQVLRHYALLWPGKSSDQPAPALVIVNLQWTPKDKMATIKIHSDCDRVLSEVSNNLSISIPEYNPSDDPLRKWAVPLATTELESRTRPDLTFD